MLFLKSQRGFSLIEVLIGMVILSILVGGVLSVTVGPDLRLFADKVVGNSSCRAEAHRIMSNFKNKGLTRSHYYFDAPTDYSAGAPTTVPFPIATSPLPAPGTIVGPVIAELAANEEGVDFAQRWADPVYTINDPAVGPSLIRPYKLTMGVISAIETIYNNNNATVCASATGLAASSAVAPLTTLLSPPNNTSGLVNPEAYLRIRAYTNNGTIINCGTNITTRPPRGTTTTTNQVPAGFNLANSVANYPAAPPATLGVGAQVLPPTVRDNISWEVNITITHTNRSGMVENCSVAERFQYPSISPTRALDTFDSTGLTDTGIGPLDSTPPLTFVPTAPNPSGPYLACNDATPPAIRLRVNHARPGSIFMCRNLTEQRTNLSSNGMYFDPGPILRMNNTSSKRQTFFSYELSNLVPADWASFVNDAADTNTGDLFYTGFFYPQGTYYCNPADGCPGLPHFPRGPDDPTGMLNTHYVLSPAAGTERFYIPSNHGANTVTTYTAATNTGTWIPCEYAAISCATSNTDPTLRFYPPTMAEFVPGSGTTPDSYRLEYAHPAPGLPSGCEFHMQIAEVDSAYNVRATEVREYILEKTPGNKLCSTGSAGAGGYPANRWYFSCDATPTVAPTTLGSANLPDCLPVANRTVAAPGVRATFAADTATACCIDFPGDPAAVTAPAAGTWGADPNNTQMIDP